MALQIGEIRTVTFTDTALLGSGVGRIGELAVFCPGTVEGDTAEVRILSLKKRYAEAELIRILTPASQRRSPDCSVFGLCGGCTFRHISYEAETALKEKSVHAALRRFPEIQWEPIHTGTAAHYRNKAVFHLDGQFRAGYYAAATNEHIDLPGGTCDLLPPLFARIAETTRQILTDFRPQQSLPFRALAVRKSIAGSFTAVLHANTVNADVRAAAEHWAEHIAHQMPEAVGLFVAHGMPEDRDVRYKCLSGEPYLTDEFLGLTLRISPAAFYQVNHDVAEEMCRTIARYAGLQPGETAADLYCGTGTIGLTLASLSPDAFVTGIEINESAVRDAVANAQANGIGNIRFRCGDSATAEQEGLHFDCVVIDPPRKGCSPGMLSALTRLSPRRIVYVSCNPATLARDAASLAEQGWQIVRAKPFDMFPRTGHCECVVCLTRTFDN